jgi:hypothetical protein
MTAMSRQPVAKLAQEIIARDVAHQPASTRKARPQGLPSWLLLLGGVVVVLVLILLVGSGLHPKPPAAAQALRYDLLNQNDDIKLDAASCDLILHPIWKIIGDAGPLEGKPATATITGSLQRTFTTTVKGGRIEVSATLPSALWSKGPEGGCAPTNPQFTYTLALATVGSLHTYPDGTLR